MAGGIYRMPAFPTQAKTVEEVRAGRKVERTERRGARVGKGLEKSAAVPL